MKLLGPVSFYFLFQYGAAQLGSLVEKEFKVKPTKGKERDCESWSDWGNCVWTQRGKIRSGQRSNLFLDQLSKQCQRHWFFRFLDNKYGAPINNVFKFLAQATTDKTPCGMCSYRQSCGFAGREECHKNPLNTERRKLFDPLYIKEETCPTKLVAKNSKKKAGQNHACTIQKSLAVGKIDAKTGRRIKSSRKWKKCQLWPSHRVSLPGLTTKLKRKIYKLHWANCVESRLSKEKRYCRCCCEPYMPVKSGRDYICRKKSGNQSRSRKRG